MLKNSKSEAQLPLADTLFFPSPERRASPRVHTICLAVKLDRGGSTALCRARNISDAGMMLDAHVRLGAEERVSIGLSDTLAVRGTVVWCDEHRCGIRFERPIDSAALLRAGAEQKREDRRSGLRMAATKLATSYAENGIRPVRVVNVSHRGMGLAHDGSLERDMLLRLILESGVEREARVRWSQDGRAGVRLLEPLSCEELACVSDNGHRAPAQAELALAD